MPVIQTRYIFIYTTVIMFVICFGASAEFNNETNGDHYKAIRRDGKTVYMTEKLLKKLEIERETWHWTPYLKTRLKRTGDIYEEECLAGNSVDSFPNSFFTDDQLRSGAVILYIIFALSSFTLVAFICDDYFLPSVEIICEKLKIPQNVAAATFMAVATSCPEFFVNVISTFLTESDMGIGTIVGSAIFNALAVAAIGGLAASKPIKISRRPVTRDVLIYMVNVGVLVTIVWDGEVQWYEAVILGVMYICYFIVMFNSNRIFRLYDKIRVCCRKTDNGSIIENSIRKSNGVHNKVFDGNQAETMETTDKEKTIAKINNIKDEYDKEISTASSQNSLWRFPQGSAAYRIWWLISWPQKFALNMTVPNPERFRSLFPVTFIMCILWIGISSYFVSWSMTVIGHTFFIPESVMGLTFVAFGGCVPEACAIFIMSRRGEGGIGVSNALGANSLAILFALGLPWLIKTLSLLVQGSEEPVVHINSAGIDFVVGSLLVATTCLWATLFAGRFNLKTSVGAVLACFYAVFVTFAILVEMGILLDKGMNLC